MDENIVYFFVAQKVVVNHSKVFLQPPLCAGGQMKRSKEDRHDQGKPRFNKRCFNIYFTCWHTWKLRSFHSSFRGTYSLYSGDLVKAIPKDLSTLSFTDYYSFCTVQRCLCGPHLENSTCTQSLEPKMSELPCSASLLPSLCPAQLSSHGHQPGCKQWSPKLLYRLSPEASLPGQH